MSLEKFVFFIWSLFTVIQEIFQILFQTTPTFPLRGAYTAWTHTSCWYVILVRMRNQTWPLKLISSTALNVFTCCVSPSAVS